MPSIFDEISRNAGQGKSCAVDQNTQRDIDFVKRQLDTFSSLETSGDPGLQMIGLLAKDVKRLTEVVERLANDHVRHI